MICKKPISGRYRARLPALVPLKAQKSETTPLGELPVALLAALVPVDVLPSDAIHPAHSKGRKVTAADHLANGICTALPSRSEAVRGVDIRMLHEDVTVSVQRCGDLETVAPVVFGLAAEGHRLRLRRHVLHLPVKLELHLRRGELLHDPDGVILRRPGQAFRAQPMFEL